MIHKFAAMQGVPEVPNALTFIYQLFPNEKWAAFLYSWDNIFYSFLVAILLSLLFYFGTKKKELLPSGLQNFLEFIVEGLETVIIGILGPEGKLYVPFLGTLFIYILTMNLLGLVPLMKSPSSSLNITLGLAICVFCFVQYLNIKNMGFFGFFYHLAGSPKSFLGWVLVPLMLPIELITQISRPITLSLRLFGNILGEKILVAFFILMAITIFFFFPIQVPFMFLGLLTSVMQAMVFTLLSTVYILLSVPHHDETEKTVS